MIAMFWKQSLHPHLNADGPGGKNAAAGASGWRPGPADAKIASVDVNLLFKKWLRGHPFCSGWWFGTFFIFPYIGNVINPIDELICFRGVGLGSTTIHSVDVLRISFAPWGRRSRHQVMASEDVGTFMQKALESTSVYPLKFHL